MAGAAPGGPRSRRPRDLDRARGADRRLRGRAVLPGREHARAARGVRRAGGRGPLAPAREPRHVPRALSERARPGRHGLARRRELRRRGLRSRRLLHLARRRPLARPRAAPAAPLLRRRADDAPTRLRIGSHRDVARALAPAGERGLSAREIGRLVEEGLAAGCAEALATGPAGTVYLCHPFLVHAAQRHRGREPRFVAQPPLLPASPLELERADGRYSPVERAIREGLGLAATVGG